MVIAERATGMFRRPGELVRQTKHSWGNQLMSDLGRKLRQLRQSKNMSIYDVERATGLHFSTISRYERNERQPSLDTLRELAEVYGASLADLIADEKREMTRQLPDDLAVKARLLLEREDLSALVGQLQQLPPDAVRNLLEFVRATRGRKK